MNKQVLIGDKGRVAIPADIQRVLGVGPGDRVLFETGKWGVRLRAAGRSSRFAKYRGIGNPGIVPGVRGVLGWTREIRGK